MTTTLVFDIEVYHDYFLVAFMNTTTRKVRHFEMFEDHPLDTATVRQIMAQYRLVSFNGIGFDLPLLALALGGADCAEVKAVCDKIIKHNLRPWALGIDAIVCDHIDLIEVAPGLASLKLYGGRLHAPRLQDLPIEPEASITPAQRPLLRQYCENDLSTTWTLFQTLQPQITLREQMSAQYGIDLRSKSDAQIAEAVIKHEVERAMGRPLPKPKDLAGQTFQYRAPSFIAFSRSVLQAALATVSAANFTVAGNGSVQMPKAVADLVITLGGSTYRMGIGGLHSTEKSVAHHADADHLLIDRDVASYYPSIILGCGLRPAQMGEHFTPIYRGIVERRLAAKRAGDTVTANALKITINGSFGKFGSRYSALYAPALLIQTTVTGQLALLMLIEMLEDEGIPVVSANTDGIVIRCPRPKAALMEFVIWEWETRTGFETEATSYRATYARDVNNYIAIKDRGYKVKGVYAPATLAKNPANEVVIDAVLRFLRDGVPVDQTIHACQDITRFVSLRTVKGGALDQAGNYLGRTARWYYAQGITGALTYKVNGYTVARSEGARPLMDLPDTFPTDVDFDWYIAEAHSILSDIGATA